MNQTLSTYSSYRVGEVGLALEVAEGISNFTLGRDLVKSGAFLGTFSPAGVGNWGSSMSRWPHHDTGRTIRGPWYSKSVSENILQKLSEEEEAGHSRHHPTSSLVSAWSVELTSMDSMN